MSSFGRYIRRVRKRQGQSLRKVAKCIGTTHAYLSQVEHGKTPSEKVILALSDVLGEDPDVLFALTGQIRPSLREVICERPKQFGRLIEQLRNAPDETLTKITRKVQDGKW